jgi:hypothetical protein
MGELCNFAAYGFSPASVVAPLGTAALVANWAFAPLVRTAPTLLVLLDDWQSIPPSARQT